MRCSLWSVVCFAMLLGTAAAQDLPTTHDNGITITPDILAESIQESQDFWGPVRKYLASEDCTVGDPQHRAEAVAFLKGVHDELHHRLFQQTEVEAMDLIKFLGHRIRMFEVYRRLRADIADDVALFGLIEHWEKSLRDDVHSLPAAEHPSKIEQLVVSMDEIGRKHGLTDSKIAAAAKHWKMQGQVVQQIASTGAGQFMIETSQKGKKLDLRVGEILLHISTAADWVLIVREPAQPIGRLDFLKSYASLAEIRSKLTAAAGSGSLR